ncbi:MAG: hypothetical protein MR357_04500 [Anaeroplasma sp.]|nr:hypothetical protein [Anaeroplasma sp.]
MKKILLILALSIFGISLISCKNDSHSVINDGTINVNNYENKVTMEDFLKELNEKLDVYNIDDKDYVYIKGREYYTKKINGKDIQEKDSKYSEINTKLDYDNNACLYTYDNYVEQYQSYEDKIYEISNNACRTTSYDKVNGFYDSGTNIIEDVKIQIDSFVDFDGEKDFYIDENVYTIVSSSNNIYEKVIDKYNSSNLYQIIIEENSIECILKSYSYTKYNVEIKDCILEDSFSYYEVEQYMGDYRRISFEDVTIPLIDISSLLK